MRLIDIKRKLHVLWIKFIYRNSEWKKYTPYQNELFNEIGIGDTYVLNRLIDSDYKQWGWLEELMTYGSVQ